MSHYGNNVLPELMAREGDHGPDERPHDPEGYAVFEIGSTAALVTDFGGCPERRAEIERYLCRVAGLPYCGPRDERQKEMF